MPQKLGLRHGSQNALVLERLQRTPGEPVPMPELVAVAGGFAIHSRISNLRALGHDIRNILIPAANGKRHSYYQLIQA
jgi:hypothetical protein